MTWGTFAEFTGQPRMVDGKWYLTSRGYCDWKRGKGGWYVDGGRNLAELGKRLETLVSYGDSTLPAPRTYWLAQKIGGRQAEVYKDALEDLMLKIHAATGRWTRQAVQNAMVSVGLARASLAMSPKAFLKGKMPYGWIDELGAKQRWFFDEFWPRIGLQDRVVVFSEWTRATGEMTARCKARGISVAHFHGGLSLKRREQVLENWDHGEYRVMVCSPSGFNSVNLHKPAGVSQKIFSVMLDIPQWYKLVQRVGRTARHGMQGTPVVLIPYIPNSIETEWAAFASRRILPDFEAIFGPNTPARNLYHDNLDQVRQL